MSQRVDRRALFTSGAAAALFAAAGVSAASAPQRGGQLRLALSGARRDDDWRQGDGVFMQVARAGVIFDTLTEVAPDGTLRGNLAMGWQMSHDAREWRFDLRPDALFHDGAAFSARDVVATLSETLPDTEIFSQDAQVVIRLPKADAALPFALADATHVIRPAHAPDQGIGTGLYRLQHFAPGQQLLAKRVTQHWKDGTAGWFDRIELVSIPSEKVRAQALAEHLVDAADIANLSLLRGVADMELASDTVLSRRLARAGGMGQTQPLDDLRAPERWWFDSRA